MCCERSTSSTGLVVAVIGAAVAMAAVSAAASAVNAAVAVAAAVVSFVATVVVTVAATSSIAAAVYVTGRLVAAAVKTRAVSPVADPLPEIGPGAVSALPAGDTTPLVIPATAVVEVPR